MHVTHHSLKNDYNVLDTDMYVIAEH